MLMTSPESTPKEVKVFCGTSPYYDATEPWIAPSSSLMSSSYSFGPKGVDRTINGYTRSRTNIKASICNLMEYLFGPGEKVIRYTDAHKILAKITHDCLFQSFSGDVMKARNKMRMFLDKISGSTVDGVDEKYAVIVYSYEPFYKFIEQATYDPDPISKEEEEERRRTLFGDITSSILDFFNLFSDSAFQPVVSKILFRKLVRTLANEPGLEIDHTIRIASGMVLTFSRTIVRFILQFLDQYIELKPGRERKIRFYIRDRLHSNYSTSMCQPKQEGFQSNYNWDFFDIKLKVLTKKTGSFVELIKADDRLHLFATMLQSTQKFEDPNTIIQEYTRLTNKCFMDHLASMTAVFQDFFRNHYDDVMRNIDGYICRKEANNVIWSEEHTLSKIYLLSILRKMKPLLSPFFQPKGFSSMVKRICDNVFSTNKEIVEAQSNLNLLCRIRPSRARPLFSVIQPLAGMSDLSLSPNGPYLHVINAICQNFELFFYQLMFYLCRSLLKVATVENAGPAERPFRIYSREYFERTFPGLQKQKKTLQSPPLKEKQDVHETEAIDKKAKKRKRESTPENSVGTDAGSQSILSDVDQESEEKRTKKSSSSTSCEPKIERKRQKKLEQNNYSQSSSASDLKQKATLQSPSLEEKEEVHDTEAIDKKAKKRKRESTPENSVGTDAGSQSILSDVDQECEEKRTKKSSSTSCEPKRERKRQKKLEQNNSSQSSSASDLNARSVTTTNQQTPSLPSGPAVPRGSAIYDRVYANFERNAAISEDVTIIFSMMLGIARNLEQHNLDLERTIKVEEQKFESV